jgi:hypothetical protein
LDQQDEILLVEREQLELEVLDDLKICFQILVELEGNNSLNLKILTLKTYLEGEDLVECEDNNNLKEKLKQNRNQ